MEGVHRGGGYTSATLRRSASHLGATFQRAHTAPPCRRPGPHAHPPTHHVFEQHRHHAGQEGAQHVLVRLALTKGGPKLAGLHRDALVLVLSGG